MRTIILTKASGTKPVTIKTDEKRRQSKDWENKEAEQLLQLITGGIPSQVYNLLKEKIKKYEEDWGR